MMKLRLLAASAAMLLGVAGGANASMTVIGWGLAEDCSKAALHGRSDRASIEICNLALDQEDLSNRDKAGTFINRGVMKLRNADFNDARRDFDAAIRIAPKVGEGWVNRGAVSIGEKRYADGLSDINHGLDLGVEEPEKAYYNRALAYEGLDNPKSAYLDYQQALTLKPNWDLPQRELLRFTVTRR
jgi:tetratricopeptide (TPR) repeat protein